MVEGKRTEISCCGCGKKIPVTTGAGHTGIAKCDCGATTYVQGEPGDILERLNALLSKAPEILKQFREVRRKGFEPGLDEALHETTRELALEILRDTPELREALKDRVKEALEDSLLEKEGKEGKEGEGPDVPQR